MTEKTKVYLDSEYLPTLLIGRPNFDSEREAAVEVPQELFARHQLASNVAFAAQQALLKHLVDTGHLDDMVRELHWREGAVSGRWREELREQVVEVLRGWFVQTLELRLEDDIPSAAEDIVALLMGPVDGYTVDRLPEE